LIRFFDADPFTPLTTRRAWLRIAGLAGLGGLVGGPLARGDTARSPVPGFGQAKSVILIFANGGQSQLEMWDPKPDAPLQVRGEFGVIPTRLPGVYFGEHMPRLARLADKYTVIKSVSHDDLDHGTATYLTLTGRFHVLKSANPLPASTDYPTYGAILKRIRPSRENPYTAIHLNGPAIVPEELAPGQNGGFLGREYEPLVIGDLTKGDSPLPELSLPPGISVVRRDARRSLLDSVDTYLKTSADNKKLRDFAHINTQAYALLDSPRIREAFHIGAEPARDRERYGWHRPGQACLLARRLAEAEVPFITVMWNHSGRGQDKHPDDSEAYGWDTHNDIFQVLRDRLLPRFDQSFSALLEDLDARGLLDQTLVVCMGEFGRAPRVALEPKFDGSTPGRKHWASVYSIVMAGAGVQRGAVFGDSDQNGAYPKSDRVGPWDVAATMFSALGIDPQTEWRDQTDRPFLATTGRPIEGIYTSTKAKA
jgi:hypothetical protein